MMPNLQGFTAKYRKADSKGIVVYSPFYIIKKYFRSNYKCYIKRIIKHE